MDERGVTFRWKDYRAKGRTRAKAMTLQPDEFMRRFLLHVLPGGFHRIRHYGLLANGHRRHNLATVRPAVAAGRTRVPRHAATAAHDAGRGAAHLRAAVAGRRMRSCGCGWSLIVDPCAAASCHRRMISARTLRRPHRRDGGWRTMAAGHGACLPATDPSVARVPVVRLAEGCPTADAGRSLGSQGRAATDRHRPFSFRPLRYGRAVSSPRLVRHLPSGAGRRLAAHAGR